jgi:hypothetical protein
MTNKGQSMEDYIRRHQKGFFPTTNCSKSCMTTEGSLYSNGRRYKSPASTRNESVEPLSPSETVEWTRRDIQLNSD